MKLCTRLRRLLVSEARPAPRTMTEELPLSDDEDPFTEPVVLEISDVLDLHAIPPRQVKAVVTEYLSEAHQRGFRFIRLIHGRGIGTQRNMVRAILERTQFVITFSDAPPEAGGWGATIVELSPRNPEEIAEREKDAC